MGARQGRGRRAERDAAARGRPEAWDAALKYLATRARTSHEVRQTLLRRGYPPDDIATVVARLAAAGYIDDADFARTWVLTRARRGAAAPARLTRELRARGIADGEIAAALGALNGEWDAQAAVDSAAQRKVKSLQGVPADNARRRLAAYLERRGFGRDLIIASCRRWFPERDDTE